LIENISENTIIEVFFHPLSYSVMFDIKDNTGVTIDFAVVIFNGHKNEAGTYIFDKILKGSYDYEVAAAGFYNYSGRVNVINADVAIQVVLNPDFSGLNFGGREKVIIYPNPARNRIHVEAANPVNRITLHDITGIKRIDIPADSNKLTIDTHMLAKGMYVMTIYTTENVSRYKIQVNP
jgi:hypothetical protein